MTIPATAPGLRPPSGVVGTAVTQIRDALAHVAGRGEKMRLKLAFNVYRNGTDGG